MGHGSRTVVFTESFDITAMASSSSPVKGRPVSTGEGFVCGAMAASIAVGAIPHKQSSIYSSFLGHFFQHSRSCQNSNAIARRAG